VNMIRNKLTTIILPLIIGLVLLCTFQAYSAQDRMSKKDYNDYIKVIQNTANMVGNREAQQMVGKYGLNILNVTWEDTGRYKDSSVGPNISDMTIQVQTKDPNTGKYQLHLMPVIRHPNFSDRTCDVKLENFYMLVGNERGKKLNRINLKKYLTFPRWYMHNPNSWKGGRNTLLAPRDTHVLVSAQACFLPIPKNGSATFNPVLFNYQSYPENPAVLTILATREGTSMTIIDNKRDAFQAGWTWGQRLFFNKNGERASFTGQRLSDFIADVKAKNDGKVTMSKDEMAGLNMVLLIQVPLKQTPRQRMEVPCAPMCESADAMYVKRSAGASNVENAVIGHGEVEGPFTEIDNLKIERDPRFPVRVTVQFYKATDNGVVSEEDIALIHKQIEKVYEDADYVGSLVTGGSTGRPTEYDGSKVQPPDWWDNFWSQYEEHYGISKEEALKRLRELFGPTWKPENPRDLKNKLDKLNSSNETPGFISYVKKAIFKPGIAGIIHLIWKT
jgi:hypothetical protein